MDNNVKLAYVSCLKVWSKDELCYRDSIGLVILLIIRLLWCYVPSCVELWFDGKTLIIDYEKGYGVFLGNCTCWLVKDSWAVVLLIMIWLTLIHSCDVIPCDRVVVNHGFKYVGIRITCWVSKHVWWVIWLA